MTGEYRGWEYKRAGDYHRTPDPAWSYTATYQAKRRLVGQFIEGLPGHSRILDLACGEGVIVETYRARGWDITGLDYNYASEFVTRGDARHLPFPDGSFDAVLLLDAIEHFGFADQRRVLAEVYRVLKPRGRLMITIPNQAHFNSRLKFLFSGKLDRTDNEFEHPGERPLSENRKMLVDAGFSIQDQTGITFTLPLLYRQVFCRAPQHFRWLHDVMEPLARMFSGMAMLNSFVCRKFEYVEGELTQLERAQALGDCPENHLFEIESDLTDREVVRLISLASGLRQGAQIVLRGDCCGVVTAAVAEGIRRIDGKVWVDRWGSAKKPGEDCDDQANNYQHAIAGYERWISDLHNPVDAAALDAIDMVVIDLHGDVDEPVLSIENGLYTLAPGATVCLVAETKGASLSSPLVEQLLPVQIAPRKSLGKLLWTRVDPSHDMGNRPYGSVAIPTYQRNDYLLAALDSVLAQKTSYSYEVLVLDNACDNSLKVRVDAIANGSDITVRYIPVSNVGLHNARNSAILKSHGKVLVYIDDDVITPDGWLEAVLSSFEDPDVHCTGGRTRPRWEAECPPWIDKIDRSYFSLLDLGDNSRPMVWPESPYGCNMAVRRDTALKLGGFAPDGVGTKLLEWYRGDGETGFARKLHASGIPVHYLADAALYHRIPPSRMQAAYIYRRAIKGAISSAYTEMRLRRFSGIQLMRKSLMNLYRALKSGLRQFMPRHRDPFPGTVGIGYLVTALYQARLLYDRKLRNWVFKEDYMSGAE